MQEMRHVRYARSAPNAAPIVRHDICYSARGARSIDPHNQYCTTLDGTPLAPLGGMTNFLMQAYVVLLLFILCQIIDNKDE